jgi:hypothetical protein
MQMISVDVLYASRPADGDVLVLSGFEAAPPSGWTLVATERGPADALDPSAPRPPVETVYQFGG